MNNLKMISTNADELRVSNYMILFGGSDLSAESFSKETLFDSAYTESKMLHVDFEHGLDPDELGVTSDDVLGYVDWKTAVIDDKGLFVERVLNRHSKYMEYIEPLIEAGIIGNSSEAIAGKTRREGNSIVEWPLKRDTLTVMPCEPRMMGDNVVSAMKSLKEIMTKTQDIDIKSATKLKDVEQVLRQKGFSQKEATEIVASVKRIHGEREEKSKTLTALADFKL